MQGEGLHGWLVWRMLWSQVTSHSVVLPPCPGLFASSLGGGGGQGQDGKELLLSSYTVPGTMLGNI